MGKTTLLKSLLLLCALIVGSGSVWGADTWEETALSDLTGSDIFVIVGTTSAGSFSLANNGGTSNNPTAASVTISNGTITSNVTDVIKWNVTGNSTDGYTFYPNGSTTTWLYCNTTNATGSNTNMRVGTGDRKVFKLNNSNYLVTEKPSAQSSDRYLCVYNGSDWRGYVSASPATTIKFYKRVASSKTDPALSFPKAAYATTFGASFVAPTLTNSYSRSITYTSSDETIAEVNESTGAITIKSKAGSTIITASSVEDATYDAGEASYKLCVYEHAGTDASPFTVAEAKDFISNSIDETSNYFVSGIVSETSPTITSGTNTYYISDDGTQTDQLQVYKGKNLENENFESSTLVKWGESVVVYGPFKLFGGNTPEINTGNYLYSITRKTAANLQVHANINDLEVTQEVTGLYTTDSNGEVTITSSNTEVADIVDNKLIAYKAGSATINVTVNFNATYAGEEKSFSVTVTVKDPVAPAGIGDVPGYYLVKNIANLANNDEVLIVGVNNANSYAMAAQNENIRNGVAVSAGFNFIGSKPAAAQAVTLEKDGDYWYFKVGDDAYLYASGGTTNNYVATGTKTVASTGDKGKAAVTIDGETGAATVTFQLTGSGAKNLFRFNYNSGNPRFTCYGSGQAPVYFYKKKEGTSYDISIGAAGWRTIVSAASASLPSGLKAYIVTGDVDGGKATLTEVASIKAGEAYVLNGDEGDYTLTVIDSPAEPTGNKLRVSTESDGNGAYVLADKSHGVGFYLWNGGSLGAGRVILPADAVTSAREFIAFDNETTGIKNLTPALSQGEGVWYDLQGRQVAQPTKGLYIVNGKKVVLK